MPIVSIKGKQFIVDKGKSIVVPNLNMKQGEQLSSQDLLSGQKLEFEVLGTKKGKKIQVVKFRNKTRYKRNLGSRAQYSVIRLAEEKKEAKSEPVDKKTATKTKKATKKKEE